MMCSCYITSVTRIAAVMVAWSALSLPSVQAAENVEPLRTIERVRQLDRDEARQQRPVLLRGVITVAFPGNAGGFVIDDGTAGIFVSRWAVANIDPAKLNLTSPLEVGMELELEGVTAAGGFAPDLTPHRITVLGKAALPPAREVTMEDLLGGHFDCMRVRIAGVVQHTDIRQQSPHVQLDLGTRGGRIPVFLMSSEGIDMDSLVDTEVEATGVAFSFFNERSELIGVNVQVHGIEDLKMLTPALKDVSMLPVSPLHSIKPFSPDPPSLHRVRVTGTVIFAHPQNFLYVQEGDLAVRVNTRDPRVFVPGERVEILGFPEMRQYFAEISEAVINKLGPGPVPEAEPITRERVLERRRGNSPRIVTGLDGRRVALQARLEKMETVSDSERRLFLDVDGSTVMATLLGDEETFASASLQDGSEVRVTGVCVVELNTRWPAFDWAFPVDFHMLVQSPADIAILKAPSWWTPQRIWMALGGVSALTAAAFAWVAVLRRQVTLQTETIRQQSVKQTLAEERSRLARELHDTLEQELMGISIQLDAAADSLPHHPGHAQQALESAHTLLSYTRTEARRSIWDLRGMALEEHGLLGALRWSSEQLKSPDSPTIHLLEKGTSRRMPARIESNLLRIGTESMTNAIKHAHATQIDVLLYFTDVDVELRVKDNGVGFNAAEATSVSRGHFGLLGMRERATQMGGIFILRSAPGEGTEIIVRVKNNTSAASN